ncbi:hypothetical protein [Plasticicumulans acidivorans]|uniref:Uncharacterized protein n=1 Tax=Plasticicumulans acidivorans TaxID=886464 RepID=A0A317MYY8_9GAMM|nr:hypothetical protein [Plasticicumulans acidivorans]PWV64558.1 hypothetical protein C7443_102208 [Plasticicumulans acidivorans]
METTLVPGPAPALSALEKRVGELARFGESMAGDNRKLRQQVGHLDVELAATRQARIDETTRLRDSHEHQLRELQATHTREVEALRSDYETQLAELRAAHVTEIEHLSSLHADELGTLREGYESELDDLRTRLQDAENRLALMVSRLRTLES